MKRIIAWLHRLLTARHHTADGIDAEMAAVRRELERKLREAKNG